MDEQAWFNLWSMAPALTSTAFVFAFGACVGSFVNVVVHRLPLGMSLMSPPSRCPVCGRRLSWYENVPVVGWFVARGRCRSCSSPIGLEYPIVELAMGILFALLYFLLFEVRPGTGFGGVTNPWWAATGPMGAAPAFVAILIMVAALVAAALIDARSFIIPGEVTLVMTVVGLCGLVVQSFVPDAPRAPAGWWAVPLPGWHGTAVGLAGVGGLFAAYALLRMGMLKRSFADYEQYVKPGETFADYPHARREMVKELLFLAPCLAGIAAVVIFQDRLPTSDPPRWLAALGASALGFVVGGGLIWAIRILGSLSFGREAMGMGDVHLMAGAGAVLGWIDPLVAMLPAIFLALGWTLGSRGWAILRGESRRELPLGPYLAVGVILVVFARPLFVDLGRLLIPALMREDMPGLFTNPRQSSAIRRVAAESAHVAHWGHVPTEFRKESEDATIWTGDDSGGVPRGAPGWMQQRAKG